MEKRDSVSLRPGEIRINTEDGVVIETKGTRVCDMFRVAQAALRELQERLEEIDEERLSDDDKEALEGLTEFSDDQAANFESAENWIENHAAEANWFWKDERK